MEVKTLQTKEPYAIIIRDFYALPIFDKKINGSLNIIEKNETEKIILFSKNFKNLTGVNTISGYYLLQCFNSECNSEKIILFRSRLEDMVKKYTNSNYMEVDPIIIAPSYSADTLKFIGKYNEFQRRKPIQLYTYKGA